MSEPSTTANEPSLTLIKFEHSDGFLEVLERLGVCLLVSTYQAGKLLVFGVHEGKLAFSLHGFDRIMGIAAGPSRIAVGSRSQIWFLLSVPELAAQIELIGRYDACYLTRSSHVTGEIHAHEMAWAGDELWFVNTLFSCLCTLREPFSFVPRWKPKFISALTGEDKCHLNGLAMEAGRPRYVTAHAATDSPSGWRPHKASGGCVIDVPSGEVAAHGFAMPHSPRLHDGKLWVLNSGQGRLSMVDPQSGLEEPVATLPGYPRGLTFVGPYAIVGLSKIRERSVFGGLPIEERRGELRCGIRIVDTRTAQVIAGLDFHSGVEEIFAVEALPGVRVAAVTGPNPGPNELIWYVPNLSD
jgi:uncharacterized protein (TIGR03032 family)